jgi:hypothetical protein
VHERVTWLVLDDGRVVELPTWRSAPACRPVFTPSANSAYYGVAAATNGIVPVTKPQLAVITAICVAVMKWHHWIVDDDGALDRRIVGHDEQAIWTPAYTHERALWGQLGRKAEPRGQRPDGTPIPQIVAAGEACETR